MGACGNDVFRGGLASWYTRHCQGGPRHNVGQPAGTTELVRPAMADWPASTFHWFIQVSFNHLPSNMQLVCGLHW